MRHFRRSNLKGKSHEKHSDTLVHTIGPGTVAVARHTMRDTEVGDRDPDGGNDTIQLGRGYGEECNVGDTCKYINIHIQVGPRKDNSLESVGWIEWGFCIHKNSDPLPTNTNLGTLTLGNVLTNYFREQCIMTGFIPVGRAQASGAEIKLKIPPKMQTMRTGDVWDLFMFGRTVSITETSTTSFRVMTSCNYINYH